MSGQRNIAHGQDGTPEDVREVASMLDRLGAWERTSADDLRMQRIAHLTTPMPRGRFVNPSTVRVSSGESPAVVLRSRRALLTPMRIAAAIGIFATAALSIIAMRGGTAQKHQQGAMIATRDAETNQWTDGSFVLEELDSYFSSTSGELAILHQHASEFERAMSDSPWTPAEGESL